MWNYSEKVKDHFFHPRNSGLLEDANAVGDVGSISCGDALRLMLKIDPASDTIVDARFQTFGCGSAIASSSALTELVIGRSVDAALGLTNRDIADYLDGLPPEKMHCSVMGAEALRAAIANYRGESLAADDHEEGRLICRCFGITADVIERAVQVNGLRTVDEVVNYTKAGGACKTCHEEIETVLAEAVAALAAGPAPAPAAHADQPAPAAALPPATTDSIQVTIPAAIPAASVPSGPATPAPTTPAPTTPAPESCPVTAPRKLSTRQKLQLIETTIAGLKTTLRRDGGDIELVDVDEDMVFVSLKGACAGCAMSSSTLGWIQEQLVQATGRLIRVIPAHARQ